ncbi:MAG: ImuA family protein [Salinarimonas sp.]
MAPNHPSPSAAQETGQGAAQDLAQLRARGVLRRAVEAFGEAHAESAGAGDHAPLDHDAIDAVLGGGLARGALHEILPEEAGDCGAAHGFALALALRLDRGGAMLWIQEERARAEDGAPYPQGIAMMAGRMIAGRVTAAKAFDPARIIMLRTRDARSTLWAMEQGLRCPGLDTVLAEVTGLAGACDLTASRRLVLAAREGGATGLLVQAGSGARGLKIASAARTRWLIGAHPSRRGLAGEPGRAAWRLHLARHRGGREGRWLREWDHAYGRFSAIGAGESAAASQALSGDLPALPRERTDQARRALAERAVAG